MNYRKLKMRSGQKIKKIKEKVIVTEQPEFESEDK